MSYIVHPAEIAQIIRGVTDDQNKIAAAWLHDAAEDTEVIFVDIAKESGQDIHDLGFRPFNSILG